MSERIKELEKGCRKQYGGADDICVIGDLCSECETRLDERKKAEGEWLNKNTNWSVGFKEGKEEVIIEIFNDLDKLGKPFAIGLKIIDFKDYLKLKKKILKSNKIKELK